MKIIKYILEAALLYILFFIFRILPFSMSSDFGFFILKITSPFLKLSQRAKKNIKIAFPDISDLEVKKIVSGMVNNLGRIIGEFCHIFKIEDKDYNNLVKVFNAENLDYLKNGGIIFTAHIGNWEIVSRILTKLNQKIYIVYRPANNPFVNKMINYYRKLGENIFLIPKNGKSAKELIKAIKNKDIIVMLVDQKMINGIEVPFFKSGALTAPAIASLALTYNIPIIPLFCVRTSKDSECKFNIFIENPLKINFTGNKNKDIFNIMLMINKKIEEWIIKNPEQWFWIHNRWAKRKTHLE